MANEQLANGSQGRPQGEKRCDPSKKFKDVAPPGRIVRLHAA